MERRLIYFFTAFFLATFFVSCTPPVYLNKERAKMYGNADSDWREKLSAEVRKEHSELRTAEMPKLEREFEDLKQIKESIETLGNPLFERDNPFGE